MDGRKKQHLNPQLATKTRGICHCMYPLQWWQRHRAIKSHKSLDLAPKAHLTAVKEYVTCTHSEPLLSMILNTLRQKHLWFTRESASATHADEFRLSLSASLHSEPHTIKPKPYMSTTCQLPAHFHQKGHQSSTTMTRHARQHMQVASSTCWLMHSSASLAVSNDSSR